MSWCTIESDPGVFTELIAKIGVKGVQVEELYGTDLSEFERLKPVYGLIFLFKWVKDDTPDTVIDGGNQVFFAKQVINNACATQAIISVLMNRPELDLGEELSNFKSFALELPPDMRGYAIGNSPQIRTVHNSFARPEPFHFEEKKEATEDDDAFHFIGYVPVNGMLYELDGLKEGPVLLGDCDPDKWYEAAKPAIEARMARYSQKEIRFTLLALVQDRKEALTQQLADIKTKKEASSDAAVLAELAAQESAATSELEGEDDKRKKWADENVRRKHNYVPFIFNLIKHLSNADKLKGLTDTAKEKGKARAEAVEKAKK